MQLDLAPRCVDLQKILYFFFFFKNKLCFGFVNTFSHLLWKFNVLIENAKTNAKSMVNPMTAAATTPKKSWWKPKYLFTKSATFSPPSIDSCMSPNCEVTIPYKVHEIGVAQEYHLHHTGILCNRLEHFKLAI